MKFSFVKGSASLILMVFIQDSSSTTGAGLGSLASTSSIVGGYVRMGGTGVALAVDQAVTTPGTYEAPATAAQVRIGTPANMRTGAYELHFHDDLFATGADAITIMLGGAANMADLALEIQLTSIDLNDGVRGGMSALPASGTLAVNPTLAATTHTGAIIPTVSTLTGHTAQSGDSFARIGAAGAGLTTRMAEVSINTTGGAIDLVTDVTTKTGFSLAATGLDAISQSAIGMVEIAKTVWDRVITGATHNIPDSAGRRVKNLQEFGTYEGGHIFIDTIGGSAGTTDYESGTNINPVNTIADANTIASSLSISRFDISPGSTFTLAVSQDGQSFHGTIWALALGGQSISATHIAGATVSGICTGASKPEFHECFMNACTIPPCAFEGCDIEGTQTLTVGDYEFNNCSGNVTNILDFGAAALDTTVNMTNFSGDVEIQNLGQSGVDIINIKGHGKIILNANCVGGTVNWVGHFEVTNNGSGITINGDDISGNVTNLVNEIGTAGAGLTDLGGMSTGMKAEVQVEANDALVANHLDHLLAVDYDPAAKPGIATALLNELVEDDAGVSRYTANALENAPSGTGASAATIADAVWDEAKADHVGAGSFGEESQLHALSTEIATAQSDLDKITGADGATLATLQPLYAPNKIAPDNAGISSNGTAISAIQTDLDNATDGLGALKALIDAVKVETAAIVLDTDDLRTNQGDWATATGFNTVVPDAAGTAGTLLGANGANLTDLGGMSTAMKVEINAEMLDIFITDTFAELASVPGATSSLKDKLTFVFMLARNQLEQTSTTLILRADDTTTQVAAATISDDTITATRGELS